MMGQILKMSNSVFHFAVEGLRYWRCVTCPHSHRPFASQGVVSCPDCAQQWRVRWWQAHCTTCQRHVATSFYLGQPVSSNRCTHCLAETISLTARWQVDYFTGRLAVCEWVSLSEPSFKFWKLSGKMGSILPAYAKVVAGGILESQSAST